MSVLLEEEEEDMAHEVYRIVVRVQLNKVEQSTVGAQRIEKVVTTQTTEGFGEGRTPREACEAAFSNGIQNYVEGLSAVVGPSPTETEHIAD
jgi:hypothetical protein